jgi:hypothetical protein
MQPILPSNLLLLDYPEDGSSKPLQNIRRNYKSTQCHIPKEYNLYQIHFSFTGPTQYTVKPRFNVPAFSEIPDLVMIFSCPDNSSILIENLHLMKTSI